MEDQHILVKVLTPVGTLQADVLLIDILPVLIIADKGKDFVDVRGIDTAIDLESLQELLLGKITRQEPFGLYVLPFTLTGSYICLHHVGAACRQSLGVIRKGLTERLQKLFDAISRFKSVVNRLQPE